MGAIVDTAPVTWVAEVDIAGRVFLVTPSLLLVPRDRVRRATVSTFQGVTPAPDSSIAIVRSVPAARYAMAKRGLMAASGGTWPAGAVVPLGGDVKRAGERLYFEAAEQNVYIAERDAVKVSGSPASRFGLGAHDKWIEANTHTGLLLLREGDAIVYATLAAIGATGTPRGKLRVFSKHLTAALPLDVAKVGGARAEVSRALVARGEVAGGDALLVDAAWGHAVFGEGKSSPGISLAPLDAKRVFEWADPELPDGWHDVRAPGTWIIVHD